VASSSNADASGIEEPQAAERQTSQPDYAGAMLKLGKPLLGLLQWSRGQFGSIQPQLPS
jgi:hypothetical protein